jgi:uncharacterized FlaG/YvyC family protein
MATKLHELLAVESNLDGQAGKTRTELMKTFQDKRHLFTETHVTYKPFGENEAEVTEQHSDIQTTVADEVQWLSKILAKAWDAAYQIDVANTLAKANVLDEETGDIIIKDAPSTALLQLEHRMKELHDFILTIPTLDPAKGFKPDEDKGKNRFRAMDVTKPRTKKIFVPLVLAAATKEHPAQVKEGYEDKAVGTVLQQEWCSMITPAKKADLLDRCDKLTRSIKKARAKANEQEVDVKTIRVAHDLLNYVFKDL